MLIKIGNIFESTASTKVNTVNCVGVMGKGIALDFKRQYPDMYKQYVQLCKAGKVHPGEPYYYQDLLGNSIINFPTKQHWRSPSKLSYIVKGLKWFRDNYEAIGITSVAFPPLGCGNGGLNWELVGPIMYRYLKDLPIDIEIYAPYGTKSEQLALSYLEENLIHSPKEVLGAQSIKFNRNWLLILKAINQINEGTHVLHVGRTIMQKLCYILTLCGVKTGFVFDKGMYGPYCKDVENAITAFANANLITEANTGRMIEMKVTGNFNFNPLEFSSSDLCAVDKTVDLFARIRNTDQAELFSTIIFTYNTLASNSNSVTELDILDYIQNWKPKWKTDKVIELPDAIRTLAILQWIFPLYSEDLMVSEELLLS